MPRISKNNEEHEVRQKKVYSDEELEKFHEVLQKYKKPFTVPETGEVKMILDWDVIYKKAGVRTDKGVIAQLKPDGTYYIPQVDFDDKLDQWDKWRGRKMYTGDRAKDYERMAEEIQALEAEKDFKNF